MQNTAGVAGGEVLRVHSLAEGELPGERRLGPLGADDGHQLADGFFHGLGHGVGLEVHEEPGLGLTSAEELQVGDVVTVEPGLYRQGYGGVRLEDLVLVTADGAENLTHFSYELTP